MTDTDFFKAKEALEKALEVINDDSASELARLKAYKAAMASEIVLSALVEDDANSNEDVITTFEEECKNAEKVIAYYKEALAEADRQYKSLISQAEFLRIQVLREWYDAMPEDIKATGLVYWDTEFGWIADVSY